MKNTLEKLFIKSIRTEKINDTFRPRLMTIEKEFKKSLSKEQLKLFVNYANEHKQFSERVAAENFKRGFWLGCGFMREAGDYQT
jgi:phenylacetate-coenzyme A ligase PaaK-like adenylate-forming protein